MLTLTWSKSFGLWVSRHKHYVIVQKDNDLYDLFYIPLNLGSAIKLREGTNKDRLDVEGDIEEVISLIDFIS